jgi:hypothetical protein
VESEDVDEVGFYEVEIVAQLGNYRNVTHTLYFELTITEPDVVIVEVEEEEDSGPVEFDIDPPEFASNSRSSSLSISI